MDFNEIFIFLALCMSLRIFKWSRKIKNLHEITNIFSRARLCTHMAALCMFSWKIVWVSLLCELKSNFHDHSLSLLTSSYSFIRARLASHILPITMIMDCIVGEQFILVLMFPRIIIITIIYIFVALTRCLFTHLFVYWCQFMQQLLKFHKLLQCYHLK